MSKFGSVYETALKRMLGVIADFYYPKDKRDDRNETKIRSKNINYFSF